MESPDTGYAPCLHTRRSESSDPLPHRRRQSSIPLLEAQLPGLKRAMPDAQYMAVPNVPVKIWPAVVLSTLWPAITVTTVPVVVCWGCVVNPEAVGVIACELPCPAMSPTARSLATVGVAQSAPADVLLFAAI